MTRSLEQGPLERVVREVGEAVRQTMYELSGTRPESPPSAAGDIREVPRVLKKTRRSFGKMDRPPLD